ncbi:MAG: M48 family metallopeptidase [Anaerolineaceae bacterium]
MDDSALPMPLEESVPAEIFKAEVSAMADRIGVEPHSINLRPMKRKWASCSSKGNLSFDIDLLTKSAAFRRKVIVHELVHLKVLNHGKLFKALEKMYLEE